MSIIGKKLHGLLNKPSKRKTEHKTVPFDSATSIGVLFTWQDQRTLDEIDAFVGELKELKEVNVLCYNELKEPVSVNYPTVNVTELSSLGKLNSKAASDFTNKPFDFLFHLDFSLNEITQSILAKSNAKCRLGIHSTEGEDYYELMIGINKNVGLTNFAEQILKYAKGIK